MKSYEALNFEFPAIILLVLETKPNFKMLYLINQLSICENVFTFLFVLLWPFKQRHFRHYQLNLNFSVDLVRFPPKNVEVQNCRTMGN